MNLKSTINEQEYDVVQGCTFTDEYNETLSSGVVVIDHVPKIRDMDPYDDVFVYTGEYMGYGYDSNGRSINADKKFYRHLLVDQYTEEIINLEDGIYKYKIELMDETKGLEVVQLPNISITQPLRKSKKRSIWDYINQYVELYSPLYKRKTIEGEWEYVRKYTIDPALEDIFKDTFAPDFTMPTPSLKDLLAKLFVVKNLIPVVRDGMITYLDISKRGEEFNKDPEHVNLVVGSKSSDNYVDNLRRNYTQGLSQEKTCRTVEYMGFRNREQSLLTLENMRLEFKYPLYKINHIYACYYKYGKVMEDTTEISQKAFMCKQDITPLILLNTARGAVSKDWTDFSINPPQSVEEMAQYKFCTLGYDIGATNITGWGETFKYPNITSWGDVDPWWESTYTYMQAILYRMDKLYPYGIYSADFVRTNLGLSDTQEFVMDSPYGHGFDKNSPSFYNPFCYKADGSANPQGDESLGFKSVFFIVDYEGFYDGAVSICKDNEKDGVTINDNASAPLTLLEQDGIYQKEKANRYGNKAIKINALYDDISQVQPLGSVYNHEDDVDVIVYHREISIYDTCINCNYIGTKNQVLKNYFTTVFARLRTWSLIPYGESIKRNENKKLYLLLDKEKSYYENTDNAVFLKRFGDYTTTAFNNVLPAKKIISCFTPTPQIESIENFKHPDQINNARMVYDGKNYALNLTSFSDGKAICFSAEMYDNVSAGIYWKELQTSNPALSEDAYKGTTQDYYYTVDDNETGFTKNVGIVLSHADNARDFKDNVVIDKDTAVLSDVYYNRISKLPQLIANPYGLIENKTISDATKFYISSETDLLESLQGGYGRYIFHYKITDPSHYSSDKWYKHTGGWVEQESLITQSTWISDINNFGLAAFDSERNHIFKIEWSGSQYKFYLFVDDNNERKTYTSAEIENMAFRQIIPENYGFSSQHIVDNMGESGSFVLAFTVCHPMVSQQFYEVKYEDASSFINVEDIDLLSMGFAVGWNDQSIIQTIVGSIHDYTISLTLSATDKNIIGQSEDYCVDNKEVLSVTYQFEPRFLPQTRNVMCSNLLLGLSDLLGTRNKFENSITLSTQAGDTLFSSDLYYFGYANSATTRNYSMYLVWKIADSDVAKIKAYSHIDFTFELYWQQSRGAFTRFYNYGLGFRADRISSLTDTSIVLSGTTTALYELFGQRSKTEASNIVFNKDTSSDFIEREDGYTYYIGVLDKGVNPYSWITIATNYANNFNFPRRLVSTTPYSQDMYPKKTITVSYSQDVTYYKNMFVLTSSQPLNEDLVYDEYDLETWQPNTEYSVGDRLVAVQGNVDHIYVCNTAHTSGTTFDSAKFTLDSSIGDDLTILDTTVPQVFSIQEETNGAPYIKVDLSRISSDDVKSVRYYYRENGALKFVFGVNVTDEDEVVKIYISLTSLKDPRVYDENHRVIGKTLNYVGSDKNYGEKQYYENS